MCTVFRRRGARYAQWWICRLPILSRHANVGQSSTDDVGRCGSILLVRSLRAFLCFPFRGYPRLAGTCRHLGTNAGSIRPPRSQGRVQGFKRSIGPIKACTWYGVRAQSCNRVWRVHIKSEHLPSAPCPLAENGLTSPALRCRALNYIWYLCSRKPSTSVGVVC